VETGYLIKNNESTTSLELKRKTFAEILKRNSTLHIAVTRTIRGTGDIFIKPESNTRSAIVQNNLRVIIQSPLKPKVLIYNVDSDHTTENLIDNLIQQNRDLRDT
jgi:hypothetical protein